MNSAENGTIAGAKMEQDEDDQDLDVNGFIKEMKNLNPLWVYIVIILCIFFLMYELGYTIGFNTAYNGLKAEHKHYIQTYCYCREDMNTPRFFMADTLINFTDKLRELHSRS